MRALGGGAQGYPAVLVRRHEVYPALPGPPLRLSVDPELFPRLPNLRLLAAAMLKAEAALSQSDVRLPALSGSEA